MKEKNVRDRVSYERKLGKKKTSLRRRYEFFKQQSFFFEESKDQPTQ